MFLETTLDIMNQRKCVAIFALIWATPAIGQDANFNGHAVDKVVRLEMARKQVVGAALAIIQQGRVVYAKGYGLADTKAGTAVSTKTVFNWASNSKPMMAIAALQLVQSGALNLDGSVRSYLPQLPEAWNGITTRHLLCHQSGIPHYRNGTIVASDPQWMVRDQTDPTQAIKRFQKSPLIFAPGQRKEYSSYAFVLLSAVVQVAGNAPIQEQLSRRILNPLGMNSFQLDIPDRQPNWTRAYKINRDGQPESISDTAHFWKHGAGGYKSNVEDFATWATALMTKELLQPTMTQVMWTTQRTSNGDSTDVGLGVFVSGSGASLKISHNGSQDETKTRMVLYPNQGHGIVVMCNTATAEPGRITTAVYNVLR